MTGFFAQPSCIHIYSSEDAMTEPSHFRACLLFCTGTNMFILFVFKHYHFVVFKHYIFLGFKHYTYSMQY